VLDVPYGPHPQQRLDLFVPERSAPAAMVLFVHGGAWSVGDKSQYTVVGERLAHEGRVAALTNHRLSPAVQHPAHVQDVARAVAWFYNHAVEYGGDPERFYLIGHSSGAHLASLVALDATYLAAEGLETSVIRGVVGIAGSCYDLDAHYATTVVAPFVGPIFGTDHTRWALAAPLHYVSSAACPFLLIHGLSDTEAPPAATETFAAALQSVGVSAELHLLPGEGHITAVIAALPLVLDFVK
jgi:acetyl esterase/lipase